MAAATHTSLCQVSSLRCGCVCVCLCVCACLSSHSSFGGEVNTPLFKNSLHFAWFSLQNTHSVFWNAAAPICNLFYLGGDGREGFSGFNLRRVRECVCVWVWLWVLFPWVPVTQPGHRDGKCSSEPRLVLTSGKNQRGLWGWKVLWVNMKRL